MQSLSFRKFLVVGSLIAFALLGILAVLPHTHEGAPASQLYDCVIHQAQLAQPHLEPPVTSRLSLQSVSKVVVPSAISFLPQETSYLPDSRAPPLSA